MDKAALLAHIKAELEQELAVIHAAASDARDAATHEDSQAENQYDTRGLEASYLAGAQASRAEALALRIQALEFVTPKAFGKDDPVGLTALVTADDGARTRTYFVAPEGGGLKAEQDGRTILVITPKSPVGRALMERREGDLVEVMLKGKLVEMELVEVA